MLRDSLFTLLAFRLGDRADLIPAMASEVQLLQSTKLERNTWLPWFLEATPAYPETVIGDEKLAMPADFLRMISDEDALYIQNSSEVDDYTALTKKTYDQLVIEYPGSGMPQAYALIKNQIYLRQVPDAVYITKLRYFAKAAVLETDIENVWLEHASDVVLAELGVVMADQYMQHSELADKFKEMATLAWGELYRVHIALIENNLERVMEA